MQVPVIDLSECTLCEGCIAVCPEVFRLNAAGAYLEVVELESYPEDRVEEAIRDCPRDCIAWEKRNDAVCRPAPGGR